MSTPAILIAQFSAPAWEVRRNALDAWIEQRGAILRNYVRRELLCSTDDRRNIVDDWLQDLLVRMTGMLKKAPLCLDGGERAWWCYIKTTLRRMIIDCARRRVRRSRRTEVGNRALDNIGQSDEPSILKQKQETRRVIEFAAECLSSEDYSLLLKVLDCLDSGVYKPAEIARRARVTSRRLRQFFRRLKRSPGFSRAWSLLECRYRISKRRISALHRIASDLFAGVRALCRLCVRAAA